MTKLSARDVVLKLRDEMLQLVNVWNAVGEYQDAADAQALAVILHQFEEGHMLTDMAWPPRLLVLANGPEIAEVER